MMVSKPVEQRQDNEQKAPGLDRCYGAIGIPAVVAALQAKAVAQSVGIPRYIPIESD